MSEKQKQPLQQDAPKSQQPLGKKGQPDAGGERDRGAGMDSEEYHRQSGHRVSDQGTHKG